MEERKCEGIRNVEREREKENCSEKAMWKVIGHTAQYGVPHSSYVCEKHKDYLEDHPHPKIMEYNRFQVRFIPLNLGKCCDDMDSAIESKFLTIRNDEIVFNIAKTPQTAGNVLTGETFDPKNYPYSLSLQYCCFCSSKLSYIQEDDW